MSFACTCSNIELHFLGDNTQFWNHVALIKRISLAGIPSCLQCLLPSNLGVGVAATSSGDQRFNKKPEVCPTTSDITTC